MYLMYVDESGDCGMPSAGSPSGLFCLSGLVVHELRWRDTMTQLLSFRHWLKGRYKVYLDDELHAADMIRYQNFPGPKNADDRGIVFPDATDGKKLKVFLETMRLSNQLKIRQRSGAFVYQNVPIRVIIEDPVVRDSQHSYLIQAADCAVFLLKQSVQPSSYMKKHGGNAYFKRLDPVLCKHASRADPEGVVRL